jgi:hypothetical protein
MRMNVFVANWFSHVHFPIHLVENGDFELRCGRVDLGNIVHRLSGLSVR